MKRDDKRRAIDDLIMSGMGYPLPAAQSGPVPRSDEPARPSKAQTKLPAGPVDLVRYAAGFYGTMLSAFAIMMAAQYLTAFIPAGSVQSVHPTKGGVHFTLTTGQQGTIPNTPLYDFRPPLGINVGDAVGKERWTFVYKLNGRSLTDGHWFWDHHVEAPALSVLFLIYLASNAYVMLRRLVPAARRQSGQWPHLLLLRPAAIWLGLVITEVTVFETIVGCLRLLVAPFLR